MTESEAIEKLEFLNEALNFQRHDSDECSCALQMGMDAIKEIQQYRAIIGLTPDDLKQLEKDEIQTIGDALKAFAEWSQYKEIGTVEEFSQLKEINKKITEEVNKQLIAGKNNYKEIYECFHKIVDIVQGRSDWSEGKE